MAKLKSEEEVIVHNYLELSEQELKGLYQLLSFGVAPAVLSELGIYGVQTVLNNHVGINTPADVKFGYKATIKLPDYDVDDYERDEYGCEYD